MLRGVSFAFLVFVILTVASAVPKSGMTATDLKCEHQVNPLGIDTTAPRFSWTLQANGTARAREQVAYRILVASAWELLEANEGDLWDSGIVPSSQQTEVAYRGKALTSGQVCYWKVLPMEADKKGTWSKVAHFEMGLVNAKDWAGEWLNDGKESPKDDADFYKNDPAPLFRKEFTLARKIKKARLAIAGLGYYEARLNGAKVGDHVLDPGWTNFDKRVGYSVYDVTRQLTTGANCLGVELGNGWYNPLPLKLFSSFNLRDHLAIGRPRVLAQLKVDYTDGTSETIATDQTWKVGESGMLRNNVYLGELLDARKEQPGWDKPGFNDSAWRAPGLAKEKVGLLLSPPQPPIRVTGKWTAVKVTEPKKGTFLYDMGVNFAGWLSLKLDVPAGTEVHLRYGELVKPDGSLNPMTSVAGQLKWTNKETGIPAGGPGAPEIAWQADTYIAKGGGETYQTKFTFHGFRYVEITGLPAAVPLGNVTAMRLNTDVQEVGSFECSNPLLNEIQTITKRTFLSNIFSVQSDCPHRERLGYGGDIVATSEAFMANYDMTGFYAKAVRDWSDSARPDGMFTDTAPYIGIQYCGVIWAMAHPLLIEQLHQYYGESRLAKEEYEAAKRWMALVEKQYPDGIVKDGLSDHESLTENPSPELVTPMYFHTANLMTSMAQRLGKKADADHFAKLASKIESAYCAKFLNPETGKVGPGTQTSQSMVLYTRIVPEAVREKVLKVLVDDIEKRNGHLSTGILGTKFMLDVLSREGRVDLAYRIATQTDFPSWGWMLKGGATTLWEHWQYSDNTFSHNHPMFGSVSQWMMQSLGGIQPHPVAVGYDRFLVAPKVPAGLDWVNSRYKSVRGLIVSNWKRVEGGVRYEIEVPVNTRANVILPATSPEAISEDGKPLSSIGGIAKIQKMNGTVEFGLGSGKYVFTVRD